MTITLTGLYINLLGRMGSGTKDGRSSVFSRSLGGSPTMVLRQLQGGSLQYYRGQQDPSPQSLYKSITECNIPRFAPFKQANRIYLKEAAHWSTNLINLEEAGNLEELTIWDQQIAFPTNLPRLRHLVLIGRWFPSNFDQTSMPHLSHLSLDFSHLFFCHELAVCPSFPFQQIRELTILFARPDIGDHRPLVQTTREILRCTTQLSSIVATSPFFSLLVKGMWEARREVDSQKEQYHSNYWMWERRPTLISTSIGPLGELSGDEDANRLEVLAQEWGLFSPEISWETLINCLAYSYK